MAMFKKIAAGKASHVSNREAENLVKTARVHNRQVKIEDEDEPGYVKRTRKEDKQRG